MKATLSNLQLLELLEGQEDMLAPLVAEEQQWLGRLRCPQCLGGPVFKEVDSVRPFSPDRPLPSFLCRCQECKTRFSPSTMILLPD